MQHTKGPIELVRLPGEGRYVWEPALDLVEFIPTGKSRGERSLPLSRDSNTYNGAMRRVARDLLNMHPAGE